MFSIEGKRAIVTGASRGIGEAIAKGFAQAGADLILVSRNLSALEKVAMEIEGFGRKALPITADIGNFEDIQRAIDTVLKIFPRIDILVNNAGISPILKRAEEVTLREWEEIVRVNLTGTFFFCQAVGKVMIQQGGGKIIKMHIDLAHKAGVLCFSRYTEWQQGTRSVVCLSFKRHLLLRKHAINICEK